MLLLIYSSFVYLCVYIASYDTQLLAVVFRHSLVRMFSHFDMYMIITNERGKRVARFDRKTFLKNKKEVKPVLTYFYLILLLVFCKFLNASQYITIIKSEN